MSRLEVGAAGRRTPSDVDSNTSHHHGWRLYRGTGQARIISLDPLGAAGPLLNACFRATNLSRSRFEAVDHDLKQALSPREIVGDGAGGAIYQLQEIGSADVLTYYAGLLGPTQHDVDCLDRP